MQLCIYYRLHRQEPPRQLGRPGKNGLYGGLFVSRAQAVKYALFENGRHPETIVEVAREIELDMGGKLAASDPTLAPSSRRAA